ncbi:MAG: SAM-dependent methyltransferase [Lachnospiraceae bacterium]|nr:SAM-dependent methyltransferase [Lachnospiraceae bacterium]
MDLCKNGKMLYELRRAKGMTQKQVAEQLGVLPKTVSKWETGHGFPDTSLLAKLSETLGVSVDTLLSGDLNQNMEEVGNMKKLKIYVCPHCGGFMHVMGDSQITCCGKQLIPLKASEVNSDHVMAIEEIENDYYVTFLHEMTKEHYISFISYVTFDKVLTVKLYPEQDSAVRFPRLYGGKFYFYCNNHGLFEYDPRGKKKMKNEKKSSLTALMSAFSRAYVYEHSENPVFSDEFARTMFLEADYKQMERYISLANEDVKDYVYTNLAPTPIGRSRFCEDCLETAIITGTTQYVILGCGFDTYAFRNNHKGLQIFEIDKDVTIEDKMKRIEQSGLAIPDNVHYIAADLSKDNLKEVLKNHGFDVNKKTLFSCLGLLYYLSRDEISKLFASISETGTDGDTVVFDCADGHLFSSGVPRVKNMLAMAEKSGEAMKSCFGYTELEKELEKHGFLIYEFLNRDEIQSRYFDKCDDGMTAFENINYVQAVWKR